jgi:RNA polymerase sigma-70 factor (ECF subfamily)
LAGESEKQKMFERVLDENKRRLHIFARKNVRGDGWKDLEQEILLQVWKSLDLYQGRSSTRTWFYAVAYNTLKEFNRVDHRPETALDDLESLPAPSLAMESQYNRREGMDLVTEFIQLLGDVDRTILLMHFDGCSYKEISEATAAEIGTLRVRIHRIKKQLAKYMEGQSWILID